ncbi:MAG: LysR family transcriptional regulator [Pseudomonadota bacterium]
MLKPRQIEAFQAVMHHGGIGRAASALGIAQPAVSRLIASLESEIGFELFERKGRGLTPTPEAHLFKREVDVFFFGLDRLAGAADAIHKSRRGHLRLSVMPAVAISLAPVLIDGITKTFPDSAVTLNVHTGPRIVDLVSAGQFDFGIAHLDQPRADVEVLGSWDVECMCVMRSDHRLVEKQEVTLTDLADVSLILLASHTSTAQKLDRLFARAGIKPDVRIEAQPSYAAFYLVTHGLGVTVIDSLTAKKLETEEVAIRPLKPRLDFSFKLVRPASARPSLIADQAATIAARIIGDGLKDYL